MSNILFTIGGYPVEGYHGDGDGGDMIEEESQGGTGPSASVRLICDWDARYVVWAGLMGSVTGGPGSIYRAVPVVYPPSPNLVCLGVGQSRGVKYIGGWNYEKCLFAARFGIPTWDVPGVDTGSADPTGQPWTTTRARVSAEVVQVPTGTYKWTSGTDSGKAIPEAQVGISIPHVEVTVTRHIMPYVPIAEAMSYIGTINNATITLENHNFTAGQFLFAGFSSSKSASTNGERAFEVEYTFLGVSGHTWNQIIDRAGNWVTINTDAGGSGNSPFSSSAYWANLP
jgi:hypothetical protein